MCEDMQGGLRQPPGPGDHQGRSKASETGQPPCKEFGFSSKRSLLRANFRALGAEFTRPGDREEQGHPEALRVLLVTEAPPGRTLGGVDVNSSPQSGFCSFWKDRPG